MPANLQLLRTSATLEEDPVRVGIGGAAYHDWYDVDIDSDVFITADAIRLTGTWDRARRGDLARFREGASLDVYVGDDRQMAGVIDDPDLSAERETIRLTI